MVIASSSILRGILKHMIIGVRQKQFLKKFRIAVWAYVTMKKIEFFFRSILLRSSKIGLRANGHRMLAEICSAPNDKEIFWRDLVWKEIRRDLGQRNRLAHALAKGRFDKRSFGEVLEMAENHHFRYRIANRYLGIGSDQKKNGAVVTTYGSWDLVHSCLLALEKTGYPLEAVVVVNDKPPIRCPDLIYVNHPDVQIIENSENLGYLESTNRGYQELFNQGIDRVLLLNDDTFVCPNSIERLSEEMSIHRSAAIGLKLLNKDLSVQEQGSVMFSTGLGENIGGFSRTSDAISPLREVDYCSAAGLLVDAKQVGEQLFDPVFAPAYYEDTDLAFRLRHEKNLRVHASYSALAFHLRGQSYGSAVQSKSQSSTLQERNRLTFVAKWRNLLQTQPGPDSDGEVRKLHTNFTQSKKLIVVGDNQLPTPDRDSGSLRMLNFLKCMRMMGFQVAFIPSNGLLDERADILFGLGVFVFRDCSEAAHFARTHNLEVKGTLLSRPRTFQKLYPDVVAEFGDKKIIYDMVDWHEGRIISEIDAGNPSYGKKELEETRAIERFALSSADQVIALNQEESDAVSPFTKEKPVIVGNILFPVNFTKIEKQYGLIFVGSANHPPNFLGLDWFFKEVWPLIPGDIRALKMKVVGFDGSEFESPVGLGDVEFTKFVEDASYEVSKSMVSVAPLLSGAGVKGKVLEAILVFTPVVTTPFGAQGLVFSGEANKNVANGAQDFSKRVTMLVKNPRLRSKSASILFEDNKSLFSLKQACHAIPGLVDE